MSAIYKIHKEGDTKTEKQWLKLGRLLKANAVGERLYTNGYCQISAIYYSMEDTYEATAEELKIIKESQLKTKREYAQNYRKRKAAERERIRLLLLEEQEFERKIDFKNENIAKALELPVIPCKNPSKIVVIDTETTGLNFNEDEILQVAACDGEGNILINEYLKPYIKESWNDAQKVHGISPEMVADAPFAHEIIPKLQGIINSADLLITYNGGFDGFFLGGIGIYIVGVKEFDVMLEFAPIYGEWNDYYGDYKWQKLSTCAEFYGYKFTAHDAKEDVLATLFCYKKMVEENK